MSSDVGDAAVGDTADRVARLEAALAAERARADQLQADNRRLHDDVERKQATIGRLKAQVAQLTQKLAASRRSSARQAAPHSRNTPKRNRRSPGRKSGKDYGPPSWRPPPDEIDEVIDVALPEGCPHCDGQLQLDRIAHQWLMELPTQVHTVRFDIHIGICSGCHRRIQPRHPRQVSDALGAAASQLVHARSAWRCW